MLPVLKESQFAKGSLKIKPLLLILIPLLIIIGIVMAYNKNLFKNSPSAQPNPLIATVGDEKIYLADIQNEAVPNGARTTTDKKILQSFLDRLEERAILKIAAKDLNIQLTEDEINTKIESLVASGAKKNPNLKPNVVDQLLKEKVTQKVVGNRTAFVLGFWIPPTDYPDPLTAEEKTQFAKMRLDGNKALPEIATKLQNNVEPLKIVQETIAKYPSLTPRMAINDALFSNVKDTSQFLKPRLYTYTDQNKGIPMYDALFSMKQSEVKTVLGEKGSGGLVIKLVSINDTGDKSYNDWLTRQKQQQVKVVSPL